MPGYAQLLTAPEGPARQLHATVTEPGLAAQMERLLTKSPELVAARARIEAMERGVPAAGGLPDPTASMTAFALPPETRVGPQRLALGARQAIPRPGLRRVQRQLAALEVERARAALEALALKQVTRLRELWIEEQFLRRDLQILEDQGLHLGAHEESARARYASGRGSAADPVRLQAALTRIETEKLTVRARLASLAAQRTALIGWIEDLPPGDLGTDDLGTDDLGTDDLGTIDLAHEALLETARRNRPEMISAELAQRRATLGVSQVEQRQKPSFSVGLAYTRVEPRDDASGRANPPEGNGDDIFALTGGVTVPLWKALNRARLAEAAAHEPAASAETRATLARIRAEVEEPLARIPAVRRQVELFREVLTLQAEEAVRSAVSGYATGSLGALDLLDAEHRLFEVRLAAARAEADLALAFVRLEGAVGAPLSPVPTAVDLDRTPGEAP